LEEEIITLKEVMEHNAKKSIKLGRPYKFNEPLTECMSFNLTKSQKLTLMGILKDAGMDLSSFIRNIIIERD